MSSLMLCKHKRSKLKLIVWATRDRISGHLQGFKYAECCKDCGCLIKVKHNQD